MNGKVLMPALLAGLGGFLLSWCRGGDGSSGGDDPFAAARERMVAEQLEARDITDPRVLQAMRRVPRHLFVPEPLRDQAFGDHPLPIGHQQTISQPYIVASMTQALEIQPGHRVLEIGTGSGYQAAVLAELGAQVFSIEIVAPLAARARETLASLGLDGIRLRTGDGWAGWPEEAPFDRIMLTAAPEDVPPPLLEQLAPGGLLIAPLGRGTQDLVLVRRTETGWERKVLYGVRFVPMTGRARNDPAPAPEP